MQQKKKRNPVNWEYIHKAYRAGRWSNRQIAGAYGEKHKGSKTYKETVDESAIRKRVKKYDWVKDLADQVKAATADKLIEESAEQVRKSAGKKKSAVRTSDEDIVDQASDLMVQIIRDHRRDIADLRELEEDCIKRLLDDEMQTVVGWYQGEASEREIGLGLLERTRIVKNLVAARGLRIKLERQAHGLDDKTDPDAPDDVSVTMEF